MTAQWDAAREDVRLAFLRLAQTLTMRETALMRSIERELYEEVKLLSKRKAVVAQLKAGVRTAFKQSGTVPADILMKIEEFKSFSELDLPTWEHPRFNGEPEPAAQQLLAFGSLFNAASRGPPPKVSIGACVYVCGCVCLCVCGWVCGWCPFCVYAFVCAWRRFHWASPSSLLLAHVSCAMGLLCVGVRWLIDTVNKRNTSFGGCRPDQTQGQGQGRQDQAQPSINVSVTHTMSRLCELPVCGRVLVAGCVLALMLPLPLFHLPHHHPVSFLAVA